MQFKTKQNVIITRVDENEIVVYVKGSDEVHLLRGEVKDCLIHCQTLAGLDPGQSEVGLGEFRNRSLSLEAAQRLVALGLLEEVQDDSAGSLVNRREFIGTVGKAAAMLPVVVTLAMPTPASAATCPACTAPKSTVLLAMQSSGPAGSSPAFPQTIDICVDDTTTSVSLVAGDANGLYFDNNMNITVTRPDSTQAMGNVLSQGVTNCGSFGTFFFIPATSSGMGGPASLNISSLFQDGGGFICGDHTVDFVATNCSGGYVINPFSIVSAP